MEAETFQPYFNSLTWNGQIFEGEEIDSWINRKFNESIPGFERKVLAFIQELRSKETFIQVNSSGSTGKSKNIRLEKHSLVESALRTQRYFNYYAGNIALLCLPVDYIAGKMMVVRALVSKLNLVLAEPVANPFNHYNQSIDFVAITPYQLQNSLETIAQKQNIKHVIVGGAAVEGDLQKRLDSLFTMFYETYGMTETCSHVAIRPLNGVRKSDSFTLLPKIDARLDERNCLVLNVPGLPQLITNDIVELSGRTFQWKGRYDNIINTGGIKVIPEEVEKVIQEHTKHRVLVGSVPNKKLGERLVLLVEKDSEELFNWELVKNSIREALNKYQIPKEVFFLATFVETENGKVKRKETVDLLKRKIE
jgi:O-succinylbenzoic acid--CoA ligase